MSAPKCPSRTSRSPRLCYHQHGKSWDAAKTCAGARSLLLATTLVALVLPLAGDDLAKHDDAVAVHEGNARQAFAVLESVAHERLLRLERALRHLVGLQGVGVLHLLATGLLAHLPLELGDTACGPSAAHETNRRVAALDLIGPM